MRWNLSRFARAPLGRPARRHGFALVVVLAIVLMVSVLIVGLLVMAENEVKATSRYMDAADSRLAADSVVQIVQGQIRKATVLGIDSATGKGTMAWASQPGAVRVFDNAGNLVNIFKLYSSDRMVLQSAADLFDGGDIPGNWESRTNDYVDLNAPVFRNGQWIYPIASPDLIGALESFNSDATNKPTTDWDDRLAMPVRWIYIRKSGEMTTDPFSGDNKGTNEVVLRVAYWTDDESSKINVNTASATDANSYSDMPRANYMGERTNMAWMQPSQNEFNRYPGHPATVSLTTVFSGGLSNIIAATPRYNWGGSENAKKSLKDSRPPLTNAKKDRLYGTPDEFLYGTNRTVQLGLDAAALDSRRFFITTTSRTSDLNLFGQPRVTIWPLSGIDDAQHRTPYDQLIAYCSTIGSGGATKPYYFVRLSPLSQTKDWDDFSRNRAVFSYLRKMTDEPIPGFGGSFLAKYDTQSGGVAGERDQILTEVFDYIRCVNLNDTYNGQPANFLPYTTKMDNVDGFAESAQTYQTFRGPGYVLPIKIAQYGTRGAGRVPVISEVGFWMIQTHDVTAHSNPVTRPTKHRFPNPPEVQPAFIVETFSPMQGFMPWAPFNFSIKVTNITAPQIVDFDGALKNIVSDDQSKALLTGPSASFGNGQALGGIDGWAWNVATQSQVSSGRPYTTGNPFFKTKTNAIKLSSAPLREAENDADRLAMTGLLDNQVILQIDNGKLYQYLGGVASDPDHWTEAKITINEGELEVSLMCDPQTTGFNQKSGQPYQTYRIKIPKMRLPMPASVDWTTQATPAFTLLAQQGWLMRGFDGPKFHANDVVRGIPITNGDFRTLAYIDPVPASFFGFNASSLPENFFSDSSRQIHGFRGGVNGAYLTTSNGGYVDVTYGVEAPPAIPDLPGSWKPKITSRVTNLTASGWEGDFDNGVANLVDGPYLNKSDEGSLQKAGSNNEPYFWRGWYLGNGLFSPLRQMPSPVVFGSLPTSVKRGDARPWRTLNFCPNPLAGSSHYGLQKPADHLLLDLFTMPVVEPYAISEPFSTAGRVNMNYQIVPFSYIKRKTALYAALSAQKVIALADSMAGDYKSSVQNATGVADPKMRYPVDVAETLRQFDQRFSTHDIFRSASEICGIFLVPEGIGETVETVANWWKDYRLTGNNSRERPYATLYPLLTTKSNVFTTHIRAQAVKRTPDGRIRVNGEYRGSVTFERFLDPNDGIFTSTGNPKTGEKVNPDEKSLEPFFRFRTLIAKQFDL